MSSDTLIMNRLARMMQTAPPTRLEDSSGARTGRRDRLKFRREEVRTHV